MQQDTLIELVKKVFSDVNGKQLIDMLVEQYVMKTGFDEQDVNGYKLAFKEGQRDMVLLLKYCYDIDPELLKNDFDNQHEEL